MRFLDMQSSQVRKLDRCRPEITADFATRVPVVLCRSCDLLDSDDLPGCASLWQEEPARLHLDLLHCWIGFCYVSQGLRNRSEIDHWRQQPICPRVHLRLCHCDRILHSDADELLQQGVELFLDFDVSANIDDYEDARLI